VVKKVLAVGMLVVGLFVLIWGTVAEISDRHVREPLLEPGVFIGAALIVSSILALGAYLLWPKSS
jgi:hypothetical protein